MKRFDLIVVFSCAAALFACSQLKGSLERNAQQARRSVEAQQPKPAEPAPAPQKHGAGPPIVVRWREVDRSATALRLAAEVQSNTPYPAPIAVEVKLPEGVAVVEGSARWSIPPMNEPGVHTVELLVRFTTTPADDLVLVATTGDASFGARAEARYAFGREVVERRVVADGTEVRIGERRFGSAVEASSTF